MKTVNQICIETVITISTFAVIILFPYVAPLITLM